MIRVRKAEDRGRSEFDWLDSRHSFSFAEYYDEAHMGYRSLRVINDDHIMGGGAFGMHPHRDMEIVTVIHEGALEHRDSMGTRSVLKAGDVQRMTAGTGVTHSEANASPTEPLHLLQIWLLPDHRNLEPGYEEKSFSDAKGLRLIVSPDGRDGSLRIHQDASIRLGRLAAGEAVTSPCEPSKGYWVQVIAGAIDLSGTMLSAGDGAVAEGERLLRFAAESPSTFLVFELK